MCTPVTMVGFDPFITITALEEAERTAGKNSDTAIKPLPLANGFGQLARPGQFQPTSSRNG
jgi:hypothetical protein